MDNLKTDTLKYLSGYSVDIKARVLSLIKEDKLTSILLKKYPASHNIKTNKALYAYVQEQKNKFLRKSVPLSKVVYDDKLDVLHQALGIHALIARTQGSNTKVKNEIRIGSAFKKAPEEFLKMIVTHELAHLKEKQHNKAFYKLCEHMEPEYHQLEFDMRLYLTYLDLGVQLY